MPINPNALSSPDPDDAAAREQGLPTTEDAKTMDAGGPEPTPTDDRTGDAEVIAPEEQPQRRRRTKAELIAAAVVPAADAPTALKDSGTGAKIERPWAEAVALVKAEKAEFVDKSLKYAVMKAEQQAVAPAFGRQDDAAISDEARENNRRAELESLGQAPATDASGQMIAPEGSEHGDEVIVGSKTYFVGPGGSLVDGVVDAPARRRWQRELGAGADGPWGAVVVGSSQNGNGEPTFAQPTTHVPEKFDVQTERLPRTVEPVEGGDDGVLKWKIGNGILEKIGLPDYSSLQVGPISASRMVVDDGRRTVVSLGDGREGEVPTAVIEAFETIDNTVEFIARRFRGQLKSFLESTGAIKQPVS